MTRISKLEARGLIGETEVYMVAVKGGEIIALKSYEGVQGCLGSGTWIILANPVTVRTVWVHYGAKLVVKEDYGKVLTQVRIEVAKHVLSEAWYASNCGLYSDLIDRLVELHDAGMTVDDLDFSTFPGGTVVSMKRAIAQATAKM